MSDDLSTREQRAAVTEEGLRRNLERPDRPDPLPGPVVDTHCHLDVADGRTHLSPADAIELAASVGVSRIVQVGCDVEGSRWAVQAAQRWDSVVASVAIHPNDAARLGSGLAVGLGEIEALAGHPQVRAIGETGLDYFRTREPAGLARQKDAFAAHIALARQHQKALVIHDRDAHKDILDVLDAEGAPERIVMHCFSGDADFARACLDRGAHLSFAGTVTFKNAEPLRDALRICPLDRILTETDAPYLTPAPYRGRPNASYLVPHTVRLMAEARGAELAELCRALNVNADTAFGGPWPEAA
ncbi:TatD family hydrolase [Microlunatus panaciterrae]|uniref:TatD DNase family protein n=1 Tax=Microlunatus panaciterrae TaxID=400768 RepID=A0ABS2RHQ7_9ACTN|nr:TatD family hydrolase [Microlunatus panaciterrae]MBM7798087.1 TatD DNase family protein [Microlunatus panaciterrae]